MMAPEETKALQDAMVALDTLYIERTGKQPYMHTGLRLCPDGWRACLWEQNAYSSMGDMINGAFCFSPQAALDNLRATILAIPTGQQRLLNDATEKTASAIEACDKAGLDAELVNPLRTMMVRLSENAIAGPKGGA